MFNFCLICTDISLWTDLILLNKLTDESYMFISTAPRCAWNQAATCLICFPFPFLVLCRLTGKYTVYYRCTGELVLLPMVILPISKSRFPTLNSKKFSEIYL